MEQSASQFDIMAVDPNIKVETLVFSVLSFFGIDVNEAASHFAEVVNKMRVCPANFRYRKNIKDNVWVVRDYYPGTAFMYKVTMVHHTPEQRAEYHNRMHGGKWHPNGDVPHEASDFNHELWVNVKFIKDRQGPDKVKISYQEGLKYAMAKTANILIGDDIKPRDFIYLKVKPMKRMFPKGYKSEDRPSKRPAHFSNQRKRRRKNVPKDGAGTV